MTVHFTEGQVVWARNGILKRRRWIIAIGNEGDSDLVVADPLLNDDELADIARTQTFDEKLATSKKNLVALPGVVVNRAVLDISEIEGLAE